MNSDVPPTAFLMQCRLQNGLSMIKRMKQKVTTCDHEEGRARPEYSQVLQDLPSAQHLLASSRKSPLNGRKINQVFVGNLEDLGGAGITEKIIGINLRCF